MCAWSPGRAGNCSVISAPAAEAAPTAPSDVGAHQLSYKLPQAQPLVRKIHGRSHLTPPVLAPRSGTRATAAPAGPGLKRSPRAWRGPVGSAPAASLITAHFQ